MTLTPTISGPAEATVESPSPAEPDTTPRTVWTYSDAEKALGHRMRAITGKTDRCDHCGAMINDCQNWPGRTGGRYDEKCKLAPPAQA